MLDLIFRLVMSILVFGAGLALALLGKDNAVMLAFGFSLMTNVAVAWGFTYVKPLTLPSGSDDA